MNDPPTEVPFPPAKNAAVRRRGSLLKRPGFVVGALLLLIAACASPPENRPETRLKPEAPAAVPEPEAPGEEPSGTRAILEKAAALLGRNDFDGALVLFDQIDPVDAESIDIRLLKASVLSSAGRNDESRAIVNGILSGDPENPEALFVLAALEGATGREREQRAILERIIKANPRHTGALTELGAIALRGRSFRTAGSYFDRVLAVEPNHGDALIGRATVYRYNREPKQAEALLNRAVTSYPQWAAPLSERARLYREAGYPNLALTDLDKAKALDGGNYWIRCDRGNVLIDLNRKQDALEEFREAINLGPDNFLAYVYTAGIKDDLGDLDGAEADYEILVKLRPDYYFAFEGLGIHKMRKHLWAEARDAFLEAYAKAPAESSYALLAAVNWIRAGRPQGPRQFLETALRKVRRESLDWYVLRLFYDLSGDMDVTLRIDRERNPAIKAKMLFYLAQFYDVRGNITLANRFFLQVKELGQRGMPEWRLNEWILAERNLKID
ncbi:MAG: tetratricopeptide repeat protein [Spirochaetaceae bacterium]|jgi:tetratricopeptide (TPR) repeat protein|nr:tetratricopeptide repeat protein [Spirochaetaceae bacterium]